MVYIVIPSLAPRIEKTNTGAKRQPTASFEPKSHGGFGWFRWFSFRNQTFKFNIQSKIEWDLTNGPLSKLLELLDTQVEGSVQWVLLEISWKYTKPPPQKITYPPQKRAISKGKDWNLPILLFFRGDVFLLGGLRKLPFGCFTLLDAIDGLNRSRFYLIFFETVYIMMLPSPMNQT